MVIPPPGPRSWDGDKVAHRAKALVVGVFLLVKASLAFSAPGICVSRPPWSGGNPWWILSLGRGSFSQAVFGFPSLVRTGSSLLLEGRCQWGTSGASNQGLQPKKGMQPYPALGGDDVDGVRSGWNGLLGLERQQLPPAHHQPE